MESDITSKIIDKIFSMKKISIFLVLIFILGVILRLIAAINLTVSADDMHHVTHAINFYSADRLITYDQSSGLWHAFTSIIYNLFGFTQLSSRFASLLFGSLTILVVFLLAKEFFDEKTSLIAAFLLAIAPFHIQNTLAEMDVMAMFFGLTSFLLFIRALKNNKLTLFAISGLFLGLAIYTKVYPILFLPSLLLYFIYFNYKDKSKIMSKANIRKISVFLLFIFLFALPALAHNYLLYKDKGFMDLQFTRTFGLGKNTSAQYYAWDHQFNAKNDWTGLIFGESTNSANKMPTLISAIDFIRIFDPVNFYLALIGIFIILFYRKENRKYLIFSALSILFALPFLASIILLPKHYIFLELLLIPMAAFSLNNITNKLFYLLKKNITKTIFAVIFIISLILLGLPSIKNIYSPNSYHTYGKSHIAQIIDFKNSNIPENALIIADSRIYRGRINWFSQGRSYLEGVEFLQFLNSQETLPGNIIALDVYYIECIPDDCGWGTIKNQPEFNASMELLTDQIKQNGKLIKTISEPIENKPYYPLFANNKEDIINIYQIKIQAKDSFLTFANQPKEWFLYTIGYEPKEKQFDYYQTNNFLDNMLNKIAHFIVTIALISAFLSPFYVIYLLNKK